MCLVFDVILLSVQYPWCLPRSTPLSFWLVCWRKGRRLETASACMGMWGSARVFSGDGEVRAPGPVITAPNLRCCMLTYCLTACCSRAFIRSIADDPALPVPSPTYLLLNTYDEHEGMQMSATLLLFYVCWLPRQSSRGYMSATFASLCMHRGDSPPLSQVHRCTTLTCTGSLGPAIWAA